MTSYFITVTNPATGDVLYSESFPAADVPGLVAALMSDDRGQNVLAENGTYSPLNTITITVDNAAYESDQRVRAILGLDVPVDAAGAALIAEMTAPAAEPAAPRVTENEHRVLRALLTNTFGEMNGGISDDPERHTDAKWSDCINDADEPSGLTGRDLGAVCASLKRKALIGSSGKGRDGTIWLTLEGAKLALALGKAAR